MWQELVEARLKAADKFGEYDDGTPMPFGEHRGELLQDVPDDWLRWWWGCNKDRGVIIIEMDHGPWAQRISAQKKLRLYDYVKRRFSNGASIQ